MPGPPLTSMETRLTEQYVSVLDFTSRCALAVDRGDWPYLWDKAAQLERAASQLREVAAETSRAVQAGKRRPRTEAVRAAVAEHGRHYRAARLLHPHEGGEAR